MVLSQINISFSNNKIKNDIRLRGNCSLFLIIQFFNTFFKKYMYLSHIRKSIGMNRIRIPVSGIL